MWLIDQLAEKKISEAIDNGELSDLPGHGQPLSLDDDSMVPEELRAGYRLLKNAGFLPPAARLRKEIASVEQLLNEATAMNNNEQLNKRLTLLIMQLNLTRGTSAIFHEDYYSCKLQQKTKRAL